MMENDLLKSKSWMLAAAIALTSPLAACSKAPEPSLDQEEGNAVDNAIGEIEDVPEDGLAAPDSVMNDMESQSGGADTNGN